MDFIDWMFNKIILTILTIFTIRDLIAAFANLPRDKKFSNFLYGKYDKNLIKNVFLEMGYTEKHAKEIESKMKDIAKTYTKIEGITKKNILDKTIYLIGKYTMSFDTVIKYGNSIDSNYYINTMEAAKKKDDLSLMANLMVKLIQKVNGKSPKVVFVPKGGNVVLAEAVATICGAQLVIVKDQDDDSRATGNEEMKKCCCKINFEGSWDLFEEGCKKKKDAILLDCNTSSGDLLIKVIKEINEAISNYGMNIKCPENVFVLYRVDKQEKDIDKMFGDHGCKLNRFFDLDEDDKEKLAEIASFHREKEGDISEMYDEECKNKIEIIKSELEKKDSIKYTI